MPRLTTTVTTTTEVTIAPKLQKKLLTELHGYASISSEMKELKAAKEGHSANVLKLSKDVDGDKFELENYCVAVVKGAKNRKLNIQKLIKRLVKDDKYSVDAAKMMIEDCTDDTPKKDHVRITVKGEKEEDE